MQRLTDAVLTGRGPRGEAGTRTSRHSPPLGNPGSPLGRGPGCFGSLERASPGRLSARSRSEDGCLERLAVRPCSDRSKQLLHCSALRHLCLDDSAAGGDGLRPRGGSRCLNSGFLF
ncbi:hypothetical protein NDU88_006300 [Pleurodeles waltl]|uniref:Uncharacterized protein n=1 Tax=Pleurodeles waltl TaxID=8319 RepID=A0AAV7PL26_PLEWA|nr:hypothetical protein NDU88_006300 [Pleurodeles waltl]